MRATLSYILLWTTYLLATAEVKLLVNLVEARWGQIDGVFGPRVILGGVGFFILVRVQSSQRAFAPSHNSHTFSSTALMSR